MHLGTGQSRGLDPKLHGLPFRSFNVGTVNRQNFKSINVYHTYVLGDKSVPNEACQVYAACHLANHEDTLIRSALSDSIPQLSSPSQPPKKQRQTLSIASASGATNSKKSDHSTGIRWHSAPHVFLYLGSEPMSLSVDQSTNAVSQRVNQNSHLAQSLYHHLNI